eukprot:comp19871_c0_seq1/m.24020 comp19871_c0_seq1/g.24020  ORF comp19871_c0_seq1/g.24020 comp19871_c0_seq1/m.24020 type:complete len:321 (-) comp19871_c0_seq1:600-1562(-)
MNKLMSNKFSDPNSYNFLGLVSKGKFGMVESAIHTPTNYHCAIKVIRLGSIHDEALKNEIDISFLVRHPCIIKTHATFTDHASIHIVQEYGGGGDLFTYVMSNGPERDESRLKSIVAQLSSALTYLHYDVNIAHRDIKLENAVLLGGFDQNFQVRLVDFGLAAHIPPKGKLTLPRGRTGTLAYLSPEALQVSQTGGLLDPRAADAWALGILCYACAFSQFPFETCSREDEDYSDYIKSLEEGNSGAIFGAKPEDIGVTEEFCCLLEGLLNPSPSQRLTCKDVSRFLADPWLRRKGRGYELSHPHGVISRYESDTFLGLCC